MNTHASYIQILLCTCLISMTNILSPVDKTCNKIILFVNHNQKNLLDKVIKLYNSYGNSTCIPRHLPSKILNTHRSVLSSFGNSTQDENVSSFTVLNSQFMQMSLHTKMYCVSSKCTTIHLTKILPSISSAIKVGLQCYFENTYFRME